MSVSVKRILRCKSKQLRFAPIFYLKGIMIMLTHQGTQTLVTDRLVLRRFREGDAAHMFKNWGSDPRVARFMSWEPHRTIEDTKKVIEKWMKRSENIDRYDWGIELDGNLIGSINIVGFSEQDEWCELGYCLGYDYWGNGYMTEAVRAVRNYLFSEIGFHRIVIRNATENPASGRVAEKCGFKMEGVQHGVMKARTGGFFDMEEHAMVREDWVCIVGEDRSREV